MTIPLLDRFQAKVVSAGEDDCWLWSAHVGDDGYGVIRTDAGTRKAHRVAYELAVGEIPKGMHLDHICRVRRCVNPKHLRLATPKQNQENTASEGRRGSRLGIRGVTQVGNRFRAQVTHNGKWTHIGYFSTAEEAGEAARRARIELFTHNIDDVPSTWERWTP